MKGFRFNAYLLVTTALGCAASPAFAQTTPPAGTAPDAPTTATGSAAPGAQPDDIVVIGIRGALDRALDTKKNAVGFVDAISAEDVGKLPDQNVAEALQRVTGVSIQRSRGEGDFVSIRGLGPNFVRGTINNRSLVSTTESRDATRSGGTESSTGRETNFDILPAELISKLEVVKSPSASQVEGGIGGVVNVMTQRPLTLGTSLSVSAKGTYRDLNDKYDPSVSGLASWANADRTFGVLAAVSYSKRSIREDDPDSFGYATFGPVIDTNADGKGDATGLSFPFSFNPQTFNETRKRITAQGTIQWAPTENDAFVLDVLYSKRDIHSRGLVAIVGTCCGFNNSIIGNGVVNGDRSVQVPGINLDGNSAVGYKLSSQITTNTDDQTVKDNLLSIGGNYARKLGDWKLALDLSYSTSKGVLNYNRVSLQTLANVPFLLKVDHDQLQLQMLPGGPDLTNLANYRTNNVDVVDRQNHDDEFAGAFDVTRDLPDSAFVKAFELGAHYRTRNVNREDRTTFNVNTDQINAAGLGANGIVRLQGQYADGDSSFPFGSLLFGDVAAVQALLRAANPNANFASQYSAPQSFRIKETAIGAYVQADIDTSLGDVPLKGNAGVRVVQTQTAATGFFQPFRIDNDVNNNNLGTIVILDPTIAQSVTRSTNVSVLPSLNLSAELFKNLFLRFAAGRSLTRPTFLQLAPGLQNINPTQRFASSGNPNLKPYISNNIDLGVEWYFGRGSALYASGFVKKIDDFIGVATNFNVTRFGVNFASLSQPVNQGAADISGIEAGYQHTFDIGIGYILNATLIDSSAQFTQGVNAGKSIPFEGVSSKSANGTLFYEKGGFNARLSYSYRSKYVVLSSDVFGNTLDAAPYGQLDGSISYTYDKRWTIFGNAINLTNEATRIYSDRPVQPVSYSVVGKRFEIGVRATF